MPLDMYRCRLIFLITTLLLGGAGTAMAQWDAETDRYRVELQQLGVSGSMFDIQSQAFQGARPERRAQMWADLETLREELAKEEMQELRQIREQKESQPVYDAETLSYKAALEKSGKSQDEINGLLTLFSISNSQVRKAIWGDLGAP